MKITPITKRPNYLVTRSAPSKETKEVWRLAREVKLINQQTQFIKDNNISASEFRGLNSKKLNIL